MRFEHQLRIVSTMRFVYKTIHYDTAVKQQQQQQQRQKFGICRR